MVNTSTKAGASTTLPSGPATLPKAFDASAPYADPLALMRANRWCAWNGPRCDDDDDDDDDDARCVMPGRRTAREGVAARVGCVRSVDG